VSSQDVLEFLEKNQVTVEKRRIQLDDPIKAVGDYQVPVRLLGDVTASLTVSVAAE